MARTIVFERFTSLPGASFPEIRRPEEDAAGLVIGWVDVTTTGLFDGCARRPDGAMARTFGELGEALDFVREHGGRS